MAAITNPTVRPTLADDLPALKAMIDANDLFPSEMLDGMMAGYFLGDAPDDLWFTFSSDDDWPSGVAYCAPERLTEGTWNMYLIAIHPERQGRGMGAALVRHIEELLARRGARILLVETSGLPPFEAARRFYRKCGYGEEARIRDFYQAGEDKIIFRKALRGL